MAHPDIEAWFKNAVGRKMNYDSAYGLQCVDAVDTYAQDIFGVPWQKCVGGVGGAKELLDVVPDAYWIRIDNNPNDKNLIPQRGDVIVWAGVAGVNPYGHTAIVLSSDHFGVDVIQQDGFAPPLQFVNNNWYSNKPAHKARLGYWNAGTGYVSGWLRPRPEKLRRITTASSTIEKEEELTVSQYKEIMAKLDQIEAIVTENQKRINSRPTAKEIWGHLIWGRTQADPGKNKNNSISVIQELANIRTAQINQDPELKKSDVVDAIQENVVTVEIRGKKEESA